MPDSLNPKWSASVPPEELAVHFCDDLFKKFKQLQTFAPERVKAIVEGVVDGLNDVSFPYPNDSRIPNYLKSMEPDYCSGHQVGSTWHKIASEWPYNHEK